MLTLALVAPAAALAARALENSDQYYYDCVTTSGRTYMLQPGDVLNSCKGSFLKSHVAGRLVSTIPLTGLALGASVYGLKSCKA